VNPPIVILTDFGTSDPYVGIMKGVIASISPNAQIIDLTHKIPPGDLARGAFILWQSSAHFPLGTIFLCVIDPGVGTYRKPIIVNSKGFIFIGPDNGLFTFILDDDSQSWILQNPEFMLPNPGNTFHGRDIFAPAAAHASMGIPGHNFGEQNSGFERIPLPHLSNPNHGELRGQILHADQYGNLVTSLGQFTHSDMDGFQPWIGDLRPFSFNLQISHLSLPSGDTISYAKTFAEIPDGQCRFIVGSTGLIEIVSNRQSAANLLNLGSGDIITLFYAQN
jgi:S-adenosylmethionine hydrolase